MKRCAHYNAKIKTDQSKVQQSFKCAHIEQPPDVGGGFLAHPINIPNGFLKN